MAAGVKHEICVFRFSQVSWTIRKAMYLATSGLPDERRRLVHQKFSKRFARACKVQEIQRVNICSNLSPSPARQQVIEKEGKIYYVREIIHQGSIGIVRQAFLAAVSWKTLRRLVDVSLLGMALWWCPAAVFALSQLSLWLLLSAPSWKSVQHVVHDMGTVTSVISNSECQPLGPNSGQLRVTYALL